MAARPTRALLLAIPILLFLLWLSFDEQFIAARWEEWAGPLTSVSQCSEFGECSASLRVPEEYGLLKPQELALDEAAAALDRLREETSLFGRQC